MQRTSTFAPVFADVDRMDAKAFASHLSENCVLRFGNADELRGRAAVEEAIEGLYATIKGLSHRIVEEWEVGDTNVVQVEVTYTRHDGGEVTLPAAVIARGANGLFDDYRIYVDLTPVYA